MKQENKLKVYALYHDKRHRIIKIECASRLLSEYERLYASNEEIVYYNENYYLSLNRKALLYKGREMKQQWIDECKEELRLIEAIKI